MWVPAGLDWRITPDFDDDPGWVPGVVTQPSSEESGEEDSEEDDSTTPDDDVAPPDTSSQDDMGVET